MNGCDLMEEVARLREDRDRLLDEARDIMRERDELRMVLDDEQAHREEFMCEAERFKQERDVALAEVRDWRIINTKTAELADVYKAERDEARVCALEMRDLYAAEIDESVAIIPFPWEG